MIFTNLRHKMRQFVTLNNIVLAVALCVGLGWVWSTVGAIQRNFTLQQQVDALQQEIAVQELEKKSQELQNKYYESQEYLELSARERLNVATPGEKTIILPPNTVVSEPLQVQTAEKPIAQRSNFDQWMYFLFGQRNGS